MMTSKFLRDPKILRSLVSGTQLLPGVRFEHQISGYLPSLQEESFPAENTLPTETKERATLPGLLIEANRVT